jgi:pyruvate dehydrogenase E2 component (dihydrolipoamide acetyltransferase)
MKAMIPALKAYPYFNASIDDDRHEIVLHHDHNFGFAAHTPDGLIVPVVKDVGRKSLLDVTTAIERLASLARERRIPVADLRGGTITLSNIGSHGGHEIGGRPIISHPQVALIATGRIRPEPAVRDNVVVPRPTLIITVSFDHRLIDGAYAAGFMDLVIEIIEAPGMLLAYT